MMVRNKNSQTGRTSGQCRCLQLMAIVPCTALENQFIRIWCKIVRLKSSPIDDRCGMVMMREWSMVIVQIHQFRFFRVNSANFLKARALYVIMYAINYIVYVTTLNFSLRKAPQKQNRFFGKVFPNV